MPTYSQPFLLSAHGSDRATSYLCSNKVVTRAGKTHVVWTDAPAVSRGRTYDHASGVWSEPVTIGQGCDNHNNVSLTADPQGHLHVVYGPHGLWDQANRLSDWPSGAFKHGVSAAPHTLAGLETCQTPFGYFGTYGNMACAPNGGHAIVYRGGEHPPALMFQRQTAFGDWTNARPLMAQQVKPEYTHYGALLAFDRQGVLYVAGHFYYGPRGHSVGVAALKSPDLGDTWTDLRGRPVETPLAYDARYAAPHAPADTDPRVNGLVTDGADRLWILTCKRFPMDRGMLLSVWESGAWRTTDVGAFLPADRLPVEGSLTLDTRGRIHLAVAAISTAAPLEARQKGQVWSDATNEIFHLWSADDGRSFGCAQISPTDPTVPHWQPTISRCGPCQPVEQPVILYERGKDAKQGTEVWGVFVSDLL